MASLHCGLMCGPLLSSHCLRASLRGGGNAVAKSVFLYNLGRMFSYTLAGAVLGYLSGAFQGVSVEFGRALLVSVGTFIIALGLVQLFNLKEWIEGVFKPMLLSRQKSTHILKLQAVAIQLSAKAPIGLQSFVFGLFTVFFPCMTLTPALLASTSMNGPLEGGVLMLAFYLGTLPVMVIAPSIPIWLAQFSRSPYLSRIISLFIILTGFWVVLKALI